MFGLPFLLAWRFLHGTTQEKNISLMIKVCFSSIVIGTGALTLIAAIMNGFEIATRRKFQGINSDLIIRSYNAPLAYEKLRSVLLKDYSDTIEEVAPHMIGHALIQKDESNDLGNLMIITGIDPVREEKISTLAQTIISPAGKHNLAERLSDDFILIGSVVAQEQNIKQGDLITLLYAPEDIGHSKTITLESALAKVEGIFKTGIDEFDGRVLFCSLNYFESLFPHASIHYVGVKLKSQKNEKQIIQVLKERLKLDVFSWTDLYGSLLSALTLEKYAMIFIFILITLVASMNLISLLFMYVTQKRSDIALFKAMGMKDTTIIEAFILIALIVSLSATIFGVLLAILLSWWLEQYPIITLPDVYYVDHLPAQLDFTIIIGVFIAVITLSLIAAWIPLRQIKNISVPQVFKFE